jgi:hypothetical protein
VKVEVLVRRPLVTMRAAYRRHVLTATGNFPILARRRNTRGRPLGERAHRQGVAERVGIDAAAMRPYAPRDSLMIDRRSTTLIAIYEYPEPSWSSMDLGGFTVEAADGSIGKVDEKTHEIGSGYLIVDTGPWIFGKKVMLPAGVISRVDEHDQRVWVNLTKDEITDAPGFDESTHREQHYRDELGRYYSDRVSLPGGPINLGTGPDYGKDDQGF